MGSSSYVLRRLMTSSSVADCTNDSQAAAIHCHIDTSSCVHNRLDHCASTQLMGPVHDAAPYACAMAALQDGYVMRKLVISSPVGGWLHLELSGCQIPLSHQYKHMSTQQNKTRLDRADVAPSACAVEGWLHHHLSGCHSPPHIDTPLNQPHACVQWRPCTTATCCTSRSAAALWGVGCTNSSQTTPAHYASSQSLGTTPTQPCMCSGSRARRLRAAQVGHQQPCGRAPAVAVHAGQRAAAWPAYQAPLLLPPRGDQPRQVGGGPCCSL